jgi:hypothetical protein
MFAARAMDRRVKKGDDISEDFSALVIKVERLEERLSNHIDVSRNR